MRNTIVGASLIAVTAAGCGGVEGSPRPDSSPFAKAACKEVPEALSKERERNDLLPLVGSAILDCVRKTNGTIERHRSQADAQTKIRGEKGVVTFVAKSAFKGGFSAERTLWTSFMSQTKEGVTSSVEISNTTMSMSAKSGVLISDGEMVSVYQSSRHIMTSHDRGTIKCAEKLIVENAIKIASVQGDADNIASFEVPVILDRDCNTANAG